MNKHLQESRKEIVEKLVEKIQSEKNLEWVKGWRAAKAPYNATTSARYRAGNWLRLVLAAEEAGYTDPRWMTYKQAADAGWQVRQGERGVRLEFFRMAQRTKETLNENGETETKDEIYPVVSFFTVFNAEQVEGVPPLPEQQLDMSNTDLLEVIDNLRESSECPIIPSLLNRAAYAPKQDLIQLPDMSKFNTLEDYVATLSHEMAHSTGHPSRLNREMSTQFGTPEYAFEELRAELSSIFMQDYLGVEIEGKHFENHAAYLQSWLSGLQDDPNELFRALADVEKITDRLQSNYQLQLERAKRRQEGKEHLVVIDIETTGLSDEDEVLQISMIDENANTLMDTYVKPLRHDSWEAAMAINGITPEMVQHSPTLPELLPDINRILREADIIVGYNHEFFDLPFLRRCGVTIPHSARTSDVMKDYAVVAGEWDAYHHDYRWQKLTVAASHYGYEFAAHDSLEDVKATLFVYQKMRQEKELEKEADKRKEITL